MSKNNCIFVNIFCKNSFFSLFIFVFPKKLMKKRLLVSLLAIITGLCGAEAQVTPKQGCQVALTLGNEVGYALVRDQGVSPITFKGVAIAQDVGVTVALPKWVFDCHLELFGGAYFKELPRTIAMPPVVGASLTGHLGAQRKVLDAPAWQLFAGVAMADRAGINYFSQMMNASYAIDNIIGPEIEAALMFRPLKTDETPSCWGFSCQLGAMPFGWVFRPGFAYIDNFASTPNYDYLFDTYSCTPTPFPYLESRLGAQLFLKNRNSIRIDYHWTFATTHSNGAWRLEVARHLISLQLNFILHSPQQSQP